MKNFFLNILAIITRRTGEVLLNKAEAKLLGHVNAFDTASKTLSDEVFRRADENDKLREKVEINRRANIDAVAKINKAAATRDRISALLNG